MQTAGVMQLIPVKVSIDRGASRHFTVREKSDGNVGFLRRQRTAAYKSRRVRRPTIFLS